jgi:glutathione S-transferase
MILFYSPGSCSLAEIVLLQWTGEPHRLCRVSRDERKGPVYRRAINPMGQVPTLLDRGAVLTENAAILPLLADRAAETTLIPLPKTRERYELYRWLSWLDSGFHSAHSPFFAPQRFVADPAAHDAVRAQALGAVREQVAHLDRHLEGRRWVFGAFRSVLDPYVFAMARWCEEKLDYARTFPHVHGFLTRMREDPGVVTGLAVEAGTVQAGGPLRGHVTLAELLDAHGRLRSDAD